MEKESKRFEGIWIVAMAALMLALSWPASAAMGTQVQGGRVTVPDVVGMPLDQAESALTTAGLMVWGVIYKPSDSAEGTVIRQRPEAGEEVSQGRPVTLTVSAGSPERAREWFRNVYQRFTELDTDQSGGLSRDEILAALSDLSQTLFDAIDGDDDGQISQAELEAFLQLSGLFGCVRRIALGGFAARMAGDLLLSGIGLTLLSAASLRRKG
ncbi:MAG TPA: PASTA domain-containing protein [Candidatus Hydrogenedentes bacterium]|nr:PASTA domain-containing protein [Candidatus Hydrogenedentota bacterium]